jgi:hypothetical protein
MEQASILNCNDWHTEWVMHDRMVSESMTRDATDPMMRNVIAGQGTKVLRNMNLAADIERAIHAIVKIRWF